MTTEDFEAFKQAWETYPSQDNEGYVPDRGAFKCGWFAALEYERGKHKKVIELTCPNCGKSRLEKDSSNTSIPLFICRECDSCETRSGKIYNYSVIEAIIAAAFAKIESRLESELKNEDL